jgi:hypothetical protein
MQTTRRGAVFVMLLLASSFLTFGQGTETSESSPQTRATHIGNHTIRETFWAWVVIMAGHPEAVTSPETDIAAFCKSQKRKDRASKDECKTYSAIQTAGHGELITLSKDRMYKWRFFDSKLSEVSITPNLFADHREDRRLDFQQELGFLTQTYGKPSEIRAVPYHNGYGAQWNCSTAQWNIPDGTTIYEFENHDFDKQGDVLAISFVSKEAAARSLQDQTKPNPYN